MNGCFSMVGGGAKGANPFEWMELFQRTPQGSFFTYQSMMRLTYPFAAMCIALGQHVLGGIEANVWDTTPGKRLGTPRGFDTRPRAKGGREPAMPSSALAVPTDTVCYTS